ncbi:hypothetical protein CLV29_2378 [Naumannella halotolerans]|uniref:Nitroimidazol reductase NimA-like FMN-containing flavoprotein (Pyridoxamine 5'-phosphate oxidase superfamily) n=2 Tax=Naumannella halotolerans TaxID=993414 RepID=A0A4R7J3P7_9ACTN|nr:hypothetical protein CLV29_2378 [Naumannella halotolerans]
MGFTGHMTMSADDLLRLHRKPDRAHDARADLDAVLDAMLIGTLSTVVDGLPWAVPTLYARDGDHLLLHGSTGAGAFRQVAAGAPAAFTVASLDAIVVADSLFDHSANYRSAVVRGQLEPVPEEEQWDALISLSERLLPGRPAEVVDMTRKELAATLTLRMPIIDGNWIVKIRSGGAGAADRDPEAWRGVVPLQEVWGDPVPEPDRVDQPLPDSVRRLRGTRN